MYVLQHWSATTARVASIKEQTGKQNMRLLTIGLLCAFFLSYSATAQQQSDPSRQGTASIAAPSTTANAPVTGTAVENDADPLMDLPPLPKGNVSLVGGKVTGIDRVRDRLTVEAFGGKKMKFAFDERTHIYRDGVETTQMGIRKGDRVYVDTQLLGTTIFARNIRVGNKPGPAYAQGQIESYDSGRGTVVVRDSLSDEPIAFRVTPKTVVAGKGSSAFDLREGALVNVKFAPDSGKNGVAEEITVTARPGETFSVAGRVTYLDMRAAKLAVENRTDGKTYEIQFDPARGNYENLGVGADVNVSAQFDGKDYVARQITVTQAKESGTK